jgi:CheY-like chemotaxis protein
MNLSALKPQPLPVLLIEDEPAVMAYVQAALERSGYPVVCCESGVDALRLLETGSFLGSYLRHAHARRRRWRPGLRLGRPPSPRLAARVVFITGDIANEETVATLRETGAPCVEKPFRVQPFIDVVAKTMGKAQ